MCERYIIVDSIQIIEKHFNTEARTIQLEKNYNLSPGQEAPVITCEDTNK